MSPPPTRRTLSALGFNMTPMIDVVLLLIIFFMLVSQFSSAEHVELELPDPYKSQAADVTIPEKLVLNIQLVAEDAPPDYYLGSVRVASLGELADRLARQRRENPKLEIVVRADRRVSYVHVREALETLAQNRIEIFHIAAIPQEAG